MGLRVWLPMTKDLRNQGLDDVTVTNNGATFNSAGKLGGCYGFNGSSQKIVNTLSSTVTSSIGSLSCWIKMNSLPGSSSFYNLLQLGTLGGYANCRLGLYMEYTNYINISIDGSSTGSNRYTHSMVANQWYHLCATYDGTTIKLYIDGNEVLSKTASKGSYTTVASNLYIGGTSSYYLNGYMNDARYYDHAISPLEVKRLSQGLCLHYRLSGVGRPNNIKRSAIVQKSTTMTYDSCEYTFVCPYLDSNWGVGFYINDTSISWKSGETWLISMDVYTPQSITWNADINNKPDVEDQSSYTGNDYDIVSERKACTNGVLGNRTLKAGWNKIWYTQKAPTTYGLHNYSTSFGIVTTGLDSGNSITVKIRNIKGEIIEDGDVLTPTPWTPNPSDTEYHTMGLDDGIEYDCSGFGNNGVKTNILWDSNTARYTGSYLFNGNNSQVKGHMDTLANFFHNDFTIAFWIYDDDKSNRSIYIGNYQVDGAGNGIGIEKTTGGRLRFWWYGNPDYYPSGFTIPDKEWTHIAIAKSSSEVKFYKNGSLINTYTYSLPNSMLAAGTSICFGVDNRTGEGGVAFKGNMSDVRFYASVLSADDILSLYNLGGSIDSNGTFHTYEYVEV